MTGRADRSGAPGSGQKARIDIADRRVTSAIASRWRRGFVWPMLPVIIRPASKRLPATPSPRRRGERTAHRWRWDMARDGFLILDSDLHMMEPDDLWARHLEGPHRSNPPKFFGGQQAQLAGSAEEKGTAERHMAQGVGGQWFPAHCKRVAT